MGAEPGLPGAAYRRALVAQPSALYLLPAAAAVAWRPRDELILAGAAGLAMAWLASHVTPAWSPRYLLVLFGPLLLVLARHAVAAPAVLLAAVLSIGTPVAKSNARAVAASVAQSVRPGDLVVVTPPEHVPVLHRYLPAGVASVTPLGAPHDPSLTDWRDAWRGSGGRAPRRCSCPGSTGSRPAGASCSSCPCRAARSAWAHAVERRTREWRAALESELDRLGATSQPDPESFRSAVRVEIFEVVR